MSSISQPPNCNSQLHDRLSHSNLFKQDKLFNLFSIFFWHLDFPLICFRWKERADTLSLSSFPLLILCSQFYVWSRKQPLTTHKQKNTLWNHFLTLLSSQKATLVSKKRKKIVRYLSICFLLCSHLYILHYSQSLQTIVKPVYSWFKVCKPFALIVIIVGICPHLLLT